MNNQVNQSMEPANHLKNGQNQMSSIKKIALLFFVCFAVCVSVSAQSELTHSFFTGIRQDGKSLRPKQVREIMSVNSEALKTFKTGSAIISVGGGVFGAGTAVLILADSDFVLVGAACFGVGLTTIIIGDVLRKKSVTLYNSKPSGNTVSYQVNFGFTQTGVGLTMRF